MLAALHRHLKERDYKFSIIRDSVFYQSKLVLEGKVKHLRQQACDFQLAVVFATSTSGRFVKLKISKIFTIVRLVGYEIGYSQIGSTGFVGLVRIFPSSLVPLFQNESSAKPFT